MPSLIPAIDSAPSATDTWAVRLGSRRQLAASVGRDRIVTLPAKSARWSSVLPVRFCRPRPRFSLRIPPSAPPILPTWEAIWPVTCSVPLSWAETAMLSARPVMASGPRPTVQPISALESSCEIGLSRLPVRLRGAEASSASRMALSAMAVGVITTEVRLIALRGGTSTSAGGATEGAPPDRNCIPRVAPRNEARRIATPIRMVRNLMAMAEWLPTPGATTVRC